MKRVDSQAIFCPCPKCGKPARHLLTRHYDDVYYECSSCRAHATGEQLSEPEARATSRQSGASQLIAGDGKQKAAIKCRACGADFVPKGWRVSATICVACATACRICGGKHTASGLCSRHYKFWLRAGKPPLYAFIATEKKLQAIPGSVRCKVCGTPFVPASSGKPKSGCSAVCRQIMRQRKAAAKRKRRSSVEDE